MHPIVRIIGIGAVFTVTSIAWLILGGVTHDRTRNQESKLGGEVNELWGLPQQQLAPAISYSWLTSREVVRSETDAVTGHVRMIKDVVWDEHVKEVSAASSKIDVALHLDQRLKGLMWYSLYDVGFDGAWTYVHRDDQAGTLKIVFQFPDASGVYDGFRFVVGGQDYGNRLKPVNGKLEVTLPVSKGDEVPLVIAYKSRGMDEWRYVPAAGVASLENFRLSMSTDFKQIDFPSNTMSPNTKDETEGGWKLAWKFDQVVTGKGIGMSTPKQLQPGELAQSLAFSAPISLFFFFLLIFVLATLQRLELHPINYLFLGGAFFAFHLLFSYSVDHLPVVHAFALSSAVSIVLVTSYLRLVVSSRFAFIESALAQLVYLVGFSLAHFWEGFTGLTVTVLSIMTLFLLMQLTGRIRWSEALGGGARPR